MQDSHSSGSSEQQSITMHVTRDPSVMERVDDPAPNQNPTMPGQVGYEAPNLTPTAPEGGLALATERTSFNGQEKFDTEALNPGPSNVQTCCNQSPRSDCMAGVTSYAGCCNSASVFPATASTASSSSPSNGSAVTFTTSEFLGPYYLQTINPEVHTPVAWGHIVAFDPYYLQTINPEALTPLSWGHIVAFDPEVLPSLSGDHIVALTKSVGPTPSSVGIHHQSAPHQIGSRLNSEAATSTRPRSFSVEPTPLLGLSASSHALMSSSIGSSASLFRPATTTGTRSSPIGPAPLLGPEESLSGVTSSLFGPRASLLMPPANTSRPRSSSVGPTSQLGLRASSSMLTPSLFGPRASLFVTNPTGPRTSCVGPASLLGHTTSSSALTSSTSLSSGKADFGVSPACYGLEPYCATPEGDVIVSISAMPVYNNMSHEELRWLHYTQGHGNGLTNGNHSQQKNNCLSSMTKTSLGEMNHSIGARTGTIYPVICHAADAATGTYIGGQSGSSTPNHISINIQIPVQLASQLLDSMNSLCRNFSSTYPVPSHVNAPTGPASNSLPMGFGTTSVGLRTSSSFANAPQSIGLFYSSTPAFGQTVTSSGQTRFHQQTGLDSGAFGWSRPPTYP